MKERTVYNFSSVSMVAIALAIGHSTLVVTGRATLHCDRCALLRMFLEGGVQIVYIGVH